MITADVHTHSSFSTDSSEPLRELASAALEKGLKTLCITEHHDFDYPEPGEFLLDVPAYHAELLRVRGNFSGRLEILFGVELGLLDYAAPRLSEFAKSVEFDFIIGSAHQIDDLDPYYPEYFDKMGDKNGISHFFDVMLSSIKAFDDFDVLGHLDYIVRYSHAKSYEPLDFREVIDEILKAVISKGKGIEINTAGVGKLGYPHPHPFVLKRYKELGGEIVTIGSDAHDRTRVAADFQQAEQSLLDAGFRHYAVFRKRKPTFYSI
ncbi:MAG: histidinol-phosphatase HisJ family protein [Oscillospiraceae bacterium]|nr:histidinol-phosphatase HisJ family protein [Oscillospiraceae bacterium]